MNPLCKDCGVCCLNTEMLISIEDIDRILTNYPSKLKLNDFAFKITPHAYQLKNENNRCFFFNLEEKKCKIYEFKPTGCEFYPLIYSLDNMRCERDSDCPNRSLFNSDHEDFKQNCNKLKQFIINELKVDIT